MGGDDPELAILPTQFWENSKYRDSFTSQSFSGRYYLRKPNLSRSHSLGIPAWWENCLCGYKLFFGVRECGRSNSLNIKNLTVSVFFFFSFHSSVKKESVLSRELEWELTLKGREGPYWGMRMSYNWFMVMVAPLSKVIKNHGIVYLQWVTLVICKIHFQESYLRTKTKKTTSL